MSLPTAIPDAAALRQTPRPHSPAEGTCTVCGTAVYRYVRESWRHSATGGEFCPDRSEWADAHAARLRETVRELESRQERR